LDAQFGPVLKFGIGGVLAGAIPDFAYGLPPLNTTLARRVMEQTRVVKALQSIGVDLPALEAMLVRFSRLIIEHPRIRSIRLGSMTLSASGLRLGPVSVTLLGAGETAPKPAIRPYPDRYVQPWTMRDGTAILFRPIRPEDEPMMVPFHESLSELSVYMRYFGSLSLAQRTAHERLTRVCFIDYDREMALVAEHNDPETGVKQILGVGRIIKNHLDDDAEFAVVVSDSAQGKGLGSELLKRLIEVARNENVRRLFGWILPDNYAIQKVCRNVGFEVRHNFDENTTEASLKLR
jgi:acetyltransferase